MRRPDRSPFRYLQRMRETLWKGKAFLYDHLQPDGLALICTMGDGSFERKSNIDTAFDVQERDHPSGKMMVAATSCRIVSFGTFEGELSDNHLKIVEKGITSSLPDFDSLMYAVVKKVDCF